MKDGGHYHTKKDPRGKHTHPMYEMKHKKKRKAKRKSRK